MEKGHEEDGVGVAKKLEEEKQQDASVMEMREKPGEDESKGKDKQRDEAMTAQVDKDMVRPKRGEKGLEGDSGRKRKVHDVVGREREEDGKRDVAKLRKAEKDEVSERADVSDWGGGWGGEGVGRGEEEP